MISQRGRSNLIMIKGFLWFDEKENSKNREESECFGSGYFLNLARALWPIFPVCTRQMEDYKKTIPPQQRVRTILSSKSNIRRSTHINFLKFDGKSFNSLVKKSHCFSLFWKLDKNTSKILQEIWMSLISNLRWSIFSFFSLNDHKTWSLVWLF